MQGQGVPEQDQEQNRGGDGDRQEDDVLQVEEQRRSSIGKKAVGRLKKVHSVDSAQPPFTDILLHLRSGMLVLLS